MKIIIGLVLLSVILNTLGQLLFKMGLNQIGAFSFSPANLMHFGFKIMTNIRIMSGLMIYVISTVVWFLVLSRADLSFAYPLVSIGYIFNSFAAYYFLHEHSFSPMRLTGTLVIIAGVVLICQS
ncbi:MAG: 4-amino-4-deoxy-L-arabinose transferase [Pseudomonadota bacterium]